MNFLIRYLHRRKAEKLRRQLIEQRAQNIADLRAGRRSAKRIAIQLARETRLGWPAESLSAEAQRPASARIGGNPSRVTGGANGSRISGILSNISFERRAA